MKRLLLCLVLVVSTQSLTAQKSQPSTSSSSTLSVLDFGAVCNGIADDTVAIQATLNAAFPGKTILLPERRCVITQTLVVGDPTTQQRTAFVSIQGSNPITSQLAWKGATNGVAVRLVRNKYFTLTRFGLLNMAGSRGSSVGLFLTGYGPSGGTETLQGDIRQINIQGFSTDILADGGYAASSEMRYDHIELADADVCWQNSMFNTLNHVFTLLTMDGCRVGLKQTVGNVSVRGGATANNGVDFDLAGDATGISDVRAELSPGSTFIQAHILRSLVVTNSYTTGDTGPATRAAALYVVRMATFTNNFFAHPIMIDCYVWPGALLLMNTMVAGSPTSPVIWSDTCYGSLTSNYRFVGNANSVTWVPYPDAAGNRQ